MPHRSSFCGRTRREFLWETGAGFTGLALTGLLSWDGFFNRAQATTKSANPLGVIEGVIPAAQNTSAPQSSKPSDLFAK